MYILEVVDEWDSLDRRSKNKMERCSKSAMATLKVFKKNLPSGYFKTMALNQLVHLYGPCLLAFSESKKKKTKSRKYEKNKTNRQR